MKMLILSDEPDPYTGRTNGDGDGGGDGAGIGSGGGWGYAYSNGGGHGYGTGNDSGYVDGMGGVEHYEDTDSN